MRWLLHCRIVSMFMVGLIVAHAPAQQPEPPDPLAGLLSKEVPPAGEVRLHITVLKLPLAEAARATLADTGQSPTYWHTTLKDWQAAGKLESVRDLAAQGQPGHREFANRKAWSFHYLSKDVASEFWDDLQEWKTSGGKDPREKRDDNELLQGLLQEEVGDELYATVGMKFGGLQASLQVKMMVSPHQLTSRPLPTWPLPGVHATRDFFRPWRLNTQLDAPLRQIFWLGSQMEPPVDGQVDTGYVLMAFGCLTPAPEEAAEPSKVPPVKSPLHRVQSWTLAVPLDTFQAWLQTRRDGRKDEATLRSWLAPGAAQVQVLGSSAVAVSSGQRASILGDLHWYDAHGFQPSFNASIYCPLSCDGDELYRLAHEMELDFTVPAQTGSPADPFALKTEPPAQAAPRIWTDEPASLQLVLTRPAAPARWVRGKTAFERTDEADPQALEVAEADVYNASESTRTQLHLRPGQVSLVSAGLRDGQVHVTFLRWVREMVAPAKVAVAPQAVDSTSALTTWVIQTPLSWRDRLLSDPAPDFQKLADALLAGLGRDEVECLGLTTSVSVSESAVRTMRPRLFFGGNYLNTAVHAQGIYFNPRDLDHLSVGTEVMSDSSSVQRPTWQLLFTQEPQVRHWGIWLPDIAKTNAKNSGMSHPTQPETRSQARLSLTPHQAEVISVIQTSTLGAAQAVKPTLQWHVVRQDPPPQAPAAADAPAEEHRPIRPQTVQLLLLKTAPEIPLPEDGQAAAALLFKAAREGQAETLECLTLSHYDDEASLSSGWDYYYPNGRERAPGVKHEDAWQGPEVMPAGTEFSDQIDVDQRLVGCQWLIRGDRWFLTRDTQAPKVVTDTFSDVIQEWPGPRPGGPDWDQLPRTRISVQRPIFQVQTTEGDLPQAGQATLTRIGADTVLVVRVLP